MLSLILFSNSYAGSIKEDYELQERCAKSASDSFKKSYGNEGILTHYSNHYNKKLNKCFILIISTTLRKSKQERPSLSKLLYDVNEQKEYASFFMLTDPMEIVDCTVLGKLCYSQNEWDTLIKPFMEE
jgi:hypothetical protein